MTNVIRLLLMLLASGVLSAAPRLLIDETKVRELRRLIQTPAAPHRAMFLQLQRQVESPAGSDPRAAYELSYRATSASFLHLLTGETRYCEIAAEALREVYANVNPESLTPEQGYGLARATVGLGFAFGYDWCGAAWPAETRDWAASKLADALAAWTSFRHANVDAPHKGSNWVSVCYGGELIELIALRRERSHKERYRLLKEGLRRHMQNMDELGVSQEGIGYTGYGGIFLLRALLALRSIDDTELEEEAARHAWWKQAMYSGTFAERSGSRVWLPSGVSSTGIGDEGWASLLFAFTPADQQPYYAWWYDRHIGQSATGPTALRYDPRREGPVWALLCYPSGVTPRDPTPVFPKAASGSAGLVFFRNRWQDADDILISFHADAAWHSHAWDQPEALQWHLFAYGASFAGGPEKTRDPANFTTLLVDGRHALAEQRGSTGKLLSFTPATDGGVASASGGSQYEAMGVDVTRTFEVRFLPGNRARIGIRDEIQAAAPHRYTWQINLGDHQSRGTIEPTAPFLLRAPRGTLEGKVVSPTPHTITPADPFRVEFEAASTRFEVRLDLVPAER